MGSSCCIGMELPPIRVGRVIECGTLSNVRLGYIGTEGKHILEESRSGSGVRYDVDSR